MAKQTHPLLTVGSVVYFLVSGRRKASLNGEWMAVVMSVRGFKRGSVECVSVQLLSLHQSAYANPALTKHTVKPSDLTIWRQRLRADKVAEEYRSYSLYDPPEYVGQRLLTLYQEDAVIRSQKKKEQQKNRAESMERAEEHRRHQILTVGFDLLGSLFTELVSAKPVINLLAVSHHSWPSGDRMVGINRIWRDQPDGLLLAYAPGRPTQKKSWIPLRMFSHLLPAQTEPLGAIDVPSNLLKIQAMGDEDVVVLVDTVNGPVAVARRLSALVYLGHIQTIDDLKRARLTPDETVCWVPIDHPLS